MSSIDYARFALVMQRCREIATDASTSEKLRSSYRDVLQPSADAYLEAHENALVAEQGFERQNGAFVEAMTALDPPYCASRAAVKAYFPDAGLPATLAELSSLFDRAVAVETLLNIIDDSFVDEAWAAREINTPFARKAPALVRELGEAVVASAPLVAALDARAVAYGPAYERHLIFKRIVRLHAGPHSGQYQSIHWRVAWGKEGAGPVSWGPFSFRAPFRTW